MYGMLENCVVCGEPLEPDGTDHRCDPRREKELAAERRAMQRPQPPTEGERLQEGFELLASGEDE